MLKNSMPNVMSNSGNRGMGLDAWRAHHCSLALLKPALSRLLAGVAGHSWGANAGRGYGERDACHHAGKRRNGLGTALATRPCCSAAHLRLRGRQHHPASCSHRGD